MSLAWLISCATDGLASNVCGSVFGLLRMASACTYLPPTWPMTFAYSFSAPIAVIMAVDAVLPEAVPPAAAEGEGDDEHPLASRTAARGRAAERAPAHAGRSDVEAVDTVPEQQVAGRVRDHGLRQCPVRLAHLQVPVTEEALLVPGRALHERQHHGEHHDGGHRAADREALQRHGLRPAEQDV